MLIKQAPDIKSSEITDRQLYLRRREFLQAAVGTVAAVGVGLAGARHAEALVPGPGKMRKLEGVKDGGFGPDLKIDPLTPYKDVTTYNNFYEFGIDKDAPAQNAGKFKTSPWTVNVDGECAKKGNFQLEDFLKPSVLEERIYRMRCVEGWSMVIPWIGIPLKDVIKRAEPTSKAKFVEFTTLFDPSQMIGQRDPVLKWPYVEGLRLDEAMHDLAILAVGLYGEVLPNQHGAPLRLVVPWKYGFKGIKSIVKIKFVEKQPMNSWQLSNAREYGFYANVNPTVDHPRWSQARERRIGEFFKRKTLMFNGYDQVAGLYSATGMDLKKNY